MWCLIKCDTAEERKEKSMSGKSGCDIGEIIAIKFLRKNN